MLDVTEEVRAALVQHLSDSIASGERMANALGYRDLGTTLRQASADLAHADSVCRSTVPPAPATRRGYY